MTDFHNVPERLVPGTLAWDLYEIEHRQRYEFFAPQCRGLKVLDAACGVGYGTQILRDQGAAFVAGIDLNFEAVNYAKAHYTTPLTTFLSGSVECLPFDPCFFDAVISFETLEHLPHPPHFLDEVKRVLKPNGLFICSTPNKEFVPAIGNKPRNPYHESEMSFHEFRAMIAQRFEITAQHYQSHSNSFLRHVQLLHHMETMARPVRFSKLLRVENVLRRLLHSSPWEEPLPLPPRLARAVPGDFVIQPLTHPASHQLTFIFSAKNSL